MVKKMAIFESSIFRIFSSKIEKSGNASICIVKGSLNMNIANGRAKLFISELTENSVAEVSDGDVYLNVPKNIQELFKMTMMI